MTSYIESKTEKANSRQVSITTVITKRELFKSIARIAKAASHKLPGSLSLNVNFLCPVCPSLFVQHVTFYLLMLI